MTWSFGCLLTFKLMLVHFERFLLTDDYINRCRSEKSQLGEDGAMQQRACRSHITGSAIHCFYSHPFILRCTKTLLHFVIFQKCCINWYSGLYKQKDIVNNPMQLFTLFTRSTAHDNELYVDEIATCVKP